MSPFMVAYPVDESDIQRALKFALENGKKVVARSGGHQYCEKSSGGKDTIVLSMNNFKTLKRLENGLVEVGPCVHLTTLSSQFKEWNITIPHGECPYVAIGGHAQTGGFGYLKRSFGLTLDYVHAFDIILSDGSLKTVTRPKVLPKTDEERLNLEIFRGVLGGNSGSFGIVTKYTFNCIKDEDHDHSYGFTKMRTYNKAVFKNLLQEAQEWTQKIENKEDDKLLEGLDFSIIVESSWASPLPPLMGTFLLYTDPHNVPYNGQFDSIIKKAKVGTNLFDKAISMVVGFEGEKKLSALSDSLVRWFPLTTLAGREFKYPYKKRVNCTVQALSNEFVEQFCTKIDEVVTKESGVKMLCEVGLNGGALRAKGNEMVGDTTITSIPHRDAIFDLSFYLFYTPGNEEKAITLQNDMQDIVDKYFHNDSHERRFFWGSFGDTNISNPNIRKMYYDSEEQYKQLQELKKRVDPTDIFHTELTVKLPEDKEKKI
jgi:hypothetical protein